MFHLPLAIGLNSSSLGPILIGIVFLLILFLIIFFVKRYKRCPSNRVLVVYGKVGDNQAARCIHGGGVMVWPVIQDYAYISLEPLTIDIELTGALSKKNIRVDVPSTFTIGVSTSPNIMANAAERLLGLETRDISAQARDIILGQMRLVIATLTIEQINQDRETFLDLVNKNVGIELNKIGLDVINVNIRDITDDSGYIDAIGKKAAADAINKAKVEVAEALREGAIGEATAKRDQEVKVAEQLAQAAMGRKEAERDQRVRVSSLEAEGVAGEARASRELDVSVAEQKAIAVQGAKAAEAKQRIEIAVLEANAVEGENLSKAQIADYTATLEERQADARRRGEVALANARRDVLMAEREQELAKLQKEEIVQKQIEREMIEIAAEAEAEKIRRIARGEADSILAKYNAEAEGRQRVLEAKAKGYEDLLKICGERPDMAPTLLMVEVLPQLVAEQVKAVQNLKIDKVTVWDSGTGGGDGGANGATAGFLRGLIGSLPPVHQLAKQAGVDLPAVLGSIPDESQADDPSAEEGSAAAAS